MPPNPKKKGKFEEIQFSDDGESDSDQERAKKDASRQNNEIWRNDLEKMADEMAGSAEEEEGDQEVMADGSVPKPRKRRQTRKKKDYYNPDGEFETEFGIDPEQKFRPDNTSHIPLPIEDELDPYANEEEEWLREMFDETQEDQVKRDPKEINFEVNKPVADKHMFEGLWKFKEFYPLDCEQTHACAIDKIGLRLLENQDVKDPSGYFMETWTTRAGPGCAAEELNFRKAKYTWVLPEEIQEKYVIPSLDNGRMLLGTERLRAKTGIPKLARAYHLFKSPTAVHKWYIGTVMQPNTCYLKFDKIY